MAYCEFQSRSKISCSFCTNPGWSIDLLARAKDFPDDGPILVITDGDCDVLRVRREHAFLLPRGRRLPFGTRAPVFEFE